MYRHFDFVVENLSEEDADALLKAIIATVESKGADMGGGWYSETDADYSAWVVIKDHLKSIWVELKAVDWLPGPRVVLIILVSVMLALAV